MLSTMGSLWWLWPWISFLGSLQSKGFQRLHEAQMTEVSLTTFLQTKEQETGKCLETDFTPEVTASA